MSNGNSAAPSITWVNVGLAGHGPESCTVGHNAEFPAEDIGHTSVLTGIGRVGSRAIEEGRGATQIGHGGRAVSIHARGDGVIVGLLGGGARHVSMW